jgi:hypothetical protein
MITDPVLHYLSSTIPLRRAKNNTLVYFSDTCPFSEYSGGKRIFRYTKRLRVGKCYHCGKSFKDLSWLKKIRDKNFDYEEHLLRKDIRSGLMSTWSKEKVAEYREFLMAKKKMLEVLQKNRKKNDDPNLPF